MMKKNETSEVNKAQVSSHETVLIMFQRVEFVTIMRIVCIIF